MTFRFSDAHIDEYHTFGYTVFRKILPASLICDLRCVTYQAREIVRERSGGQVQRLQPVGKYDMDQQPFIDYAELPELVDAVTLVLTPRHRYGKRDIIGVLLEPRDFPWCTSWHRDWRDNVEGLPLALWDKFFSDINLFNQINCALYEDSSTWVVPGSHLRRDLPREIELFPDRPIHRPELNDRTVEEREILCLNYCQSMPGGVQLYLGAGDFALYRNTLWHIGSYVPYRKRATIHDSIMTPEFIDWTSKALAAVEQRRNAGYGMENPYLKS